MTVRTRDRRWMHGVQLAIRCLDEAGHCGPEADGYVLNAHEYGFEQKNVVLDYLRKAREVGADAEEGFCAALSDSISQGSYPEALEKFARSQLNHLRTQRQADSVEAAAIAVRS